MAYQWEEQGRGDRHTIWAGRFTSNSAPMLDNKGMPKDARGDNAD